MSFMTGKTQNSVLATTVPEGSEVAYTAQRVVAV